MAELKDLWPADNPHLAITEIAEWFAAYVYLPKLRDRVVLETSIRDAIGKFDAAFGYAEGFDAGHRSVRRPDLGEGRAGNPRPAWASGSRRGRQRATWPRTRSRRLNSLTTGARPTPRKAKARRITAAPAATLEAAQVLRLCRDRHEPPREGVRHDPELRS